MIMKPAIQLLRDIVPIDLQARLEAQPDGAIEYSEQGFSLSLLKRLNDRISIVRKRLAFVEDRAVKQNLTEIIELLESARAQDYCPVWQGYFMDGTTRVEFVIAPVLARRIVAKFDTQ
jgi:hypothetical protein